MTTENQAPHYGDFSVITLLQITCLSVVSIGLALALSIIIGGFSIW